MPSAKPVFHERTCMFCGGTAAVAALSDASELDVDAEFSSQGRAFGTEDEMVGVGCWRCSRERWPLQVVSDA